MALWVSFEGVFTCTGKWCAALHDTVDIVGNLVRIIVEGVDLEVMPHLVHAAARLDSSISPINGSVVVAIDI